MTAVVQTSDLSRMWWIVLLQGIATLIMGILLVTAPGVTVAVIVRFLGFYWLINGIFDIIDIFLRSSGRPWIWSLIAGVLGILAGIAVLDHPLLSTILLPAVLVIFIGVDGLVLGIVHIIQGIGVKEWGTVILGIVSTIFGLALLGEPILGASILPIALGISGIVGGILVTIFAFRVRNL